MNEKPFSGPRCKVDPVYLRKPQSPEGHHPYSGKAKKWSSLMEIDQQPFFSPRFSPSSQSPSSFRPSFFFFSCSLNSTGPFFVFRQTFHFPVELSPLSQVLLSYLSEQLILLSIALLVQIAHPSLLSVVLLGVCLLRTKDSSSSFFLN